MLDMIDQVLDEVIIKVNKLNANTSEYVKRMLEVMEYDVSLYFECDYGAAWS